MRWSKMAAPHIFGPAEKAQKPTSNAHPRGGLGFCFSLGFVCAQAPIHRD